MARGRKKAVAEAIEAAKPAESAGSDDKPFSGPDALLRRFKMLETGLHLKRDDNPLWWICAPFTIAAETRDEAGGWGILIRWQDRDGSLREEVFARELFSGDCREVRNRLAAGGLTISGNQQARTAFVEYLNLVRAPARAMVVDRTGWHQIGGKTIFVLPERVIGNPAERVLLQGAARDRAPFGQGGTLDSWRRDVALYAGGNSRLAFCVSTAFAGALLALADEDGGGWNIRGISRSGKTTALRLAASVWGGDEQQGASAFMRSWRATANGLEAVATLYSDMLLPLDEMGAVDAAELGDVCYMLGNGHGKSRAGRDGAARTAAKWRLLFLSTGETGLADKNAEARRSTKPGQEVRLVDLAADAGAGLGVFEELHGFANADELANHLKAACRQNYGTAGIAFVEYITGAMARDPEYAPELRERIGRVVNAELLAGIGEAGGQVRSVARRFALVAVAGEIATTAMITGWAAGEATAAVKVMFASWLAERGTTGAREDLQAKQQLANYISRYGVSRFEIWGDPPDAAQVPPGESLTPPVERIRPRDRAGWRRFGKSELAYGFCYYMTKEAMEEALTGLDFRSSIKALAEAGFILKDKEGRNITGCKPPGHPKNIRLFRVPANVMGFIGEDDG